MTSLFIGGGFSESQLLKVIPVAHGLSVQNGIKTWIFEDSQFRKFNGVPELEEILSNYRVTVWQSVESKPFRRLILSIFFIARNALSILSLALAARRGNLLVDGDWSRVQLIHATWDRALQSVPDGTIRVSLLRRVFSARRALKMYKATIRFVEDEGVRLALLGHTVYEWRAALVAFREAGVKVLGQAAFVFYSLPPDYDLAWDMLSAKERSSLFSLVSPSESERYWESRLSGLGAYSDARIAARGEDVVSTETPKNLLMLHVFRDSPFNYLDMHRLFDDYVDWVLGTIRILADSTETWLIKPHPSAKRWGEDQDIWLKKIARHVLKSEGLPNNVTVLDRDVSNIGLLANARRVVTFGGTAHLEAACFGIKPITIMDTTLAQFSPGAVLKPRSMGQYRELLLCNSYLDLFQLNQAEINLSRRVLYLREKVLTIERDIGALPVYRGDSVSQQIANYESMLHKLPDSWPELVRQGKELGTGLPRTVAFDFFDRWREEYAKLP